MYAKLCLNDNSGLFQPGLVDVTLGVLLTLRWVAQVRHPCTEVFRKALEQQGDGTFNPDIGGFVPESLQQRWRETSEAQAHNNEKYSRLEKQNRVVL